MKKFFLVVLTSFLLLLCISTFSTASVINFDNFDVGSSGWFLIDSVLSLGDGFTATQNSGASIIISENYSSGWQDAVSSSANAFGLVGGSMRFQQGGNVFNFDGAFFTNVFALNLSFSLMGKLNGVEAYQNTYDLELASNNILLTALGYNGIDELVITNTTSGWFGVDDFVYNSAPASVPEPSTILLLGFGLVGLIFCQRKANK